MSPTETPDAQHLGELEAEGFDHGLRRTERAELAERWGQAFADAAPTEGGAPTPAQVLALQSRLELFIQFHDAVVSSRAWRLLQALRRPFGRAW